MTDAHYSSYAELLEKVEWDKYGVVDVWRETAAARIAWCTAATSRPRPGRNAQAAAMRGKISASISAETENPPVATEITAFKRRPLPAMTFDRQTR